MYRMLSDEELNLVWTVIGLSEEGRTITVRKRCPFGGPERVAVLRYRPPAQKGAKGLATAVGPWFRTAWLVDGPESLDKLAGEVRIWLRMGSPDLWSAPELQSQDGEAEPGPQPQTMQEDSSRTDEPERRSVRRMELWAAASGLLTALRSLAGEMYASCGHPSQVNEALSGLAGLEEELYSEISDAQGGTEISRPRP